jgi:D-sedoheptulose 7-phosphate isomerase
MGPSGAEVIKAELLSHVQTLEITTAQATSLIVRVAVCLSDAFARGNKVLLCGNGGSAADAQHVAAEFVNRFRNERRGLPALALTTDTSVLTSIGNDLSFSEVFSRQVEALAQAGDVLIGISTSGRSANVLAALKLARTHGVTTVGLTGEGGGESMAALCDYCVVVPSTDTARIQECHAFILHVLCGMVETRLLGPRPGSGGGAR